MWRNIVDTYTNSFWRDRRGRTTLGFVLLFLAVVVAVLVYWQLRLSGIAMTNETYCGYEEHTHTEECYESVLICGLEEIEGHTHNETCYDEEGNLVCELEECEPHTHRDECYETTLICELEEHVHTVDCLVDLEADVEDATVWEATLPELTGDLRTDIVNIAYSQIGYTESTANYTLAEDGITHIGYTRYGAWYGGLYYGSEYSDWDSMFVAFCLDYAGIAEEFTYNSGAYAWSVELSDLGYYQTADSYTPEVGDVVFVDSDLDGRADITAIVVAVDESAITVIQGNYADTVALVEYALDENVLGYADVDYTEEVEEDEEITLDESDEIITEEIEELDVSAEDLATLEFIGEDYIITVSYGEDAALPEGTELVAYEYAQDSENFLARYAEAALLYGWSSSETEEIAETDEEITITEEAVTASVTGEVTGYASTEPVEEPVATDPYHGFRLFNIGLYYEGIEIEPAAAVTVTVTYIGEDADMDSVYVTHFTDTSTEPLPATVEITEDTQSVTFTSDSFSEFGIMVASEDENEIATVAEEGTGLYVTVDVLVEVNVADVISSLNGSSFIITGNQRTRAMQAEESSSTMASVVVDGTNISELTQWTFTSGNNGGYYISSGGSYLKMGYSNESNGTLSLVDSTADATEFTVYAYERTDGVSYLVMTATINGYTYYINKQGGESSSAGFVAYSSSPETTGDNSRLLIYTVGTETIECSSVDQFYLWIHDNSDTLIASYGTWNSATSSFDNDYITDALKYTDSNSETWFLIPLSYFTDAFKTYGFTFDATECPFQYAPNARTTSTRVDASYVTVDGEYYIRVQDTTNLSPNRSNVYYTKNKTAYVITDTVSPSGTVINLFDYWTTSQDAVDVGLSNNADEGVNAGHTLKFAYYPKQWDVSKNEEYNISSGADVYPNIVQNKLVNGYPALNIDTTKSTESLDYLFNPKYTGASEYRATYSNVQGLLQVNENGYYSYNSDSNYAEFDTSSNSFTIYSEEAVGFFPFDSYNEAASASSAEDSTFNHYFGMSITTRFVQQNGGYTSSSKTTATTFEFSGDDDVWIFIDDVLVADLGGIHSAISVVIDFSTGAVTVKNSNGESLSTSTTIKAAYEAAGVDSNYSWTAVTSDDESVSYTYENGTYHTLKFYYLERGNSASNLMLKFNLSVIPETSITKVNQYGEAIEGAEFAVYSATKDDDGNYWYLYDSYDESTAPNNKELATSVSAKIDSGDYYIDDNGKICVTESNTPLISAKYVGTTDSNGEMTFVDNDLLPYTLTELETIFGTYFIAREISVPEGYRLVSEDIYLRIVNGQTLDCDNTYESGVYAAATELITSTDTIYAASDNSSITYYNPSTGKVNGTLFAVVMKYTGTDDASTDNDASHWAPVYGTDEIGYTVMSGYTNAIEAAIEAAKIMENNGYSDSVFSLSTSGEMQVYLTALPGDISTYYYLAQDSSTQYTIAVYYTTADSLDEATSSNTVRIDATEFTRIFGASIQVPNLSNMLLVQKLDVYGNLVNGARFALYEVEEVTYEVEEVTKNKIYYVGYDNSRTKTLIYLYPDDDGDNAGTAELEDGSTGTYTISSAEDKTEGVITVEIGGTTYTITPKEVETTAKAGEQTSAYTHFEYTTDEDGTAVFDNLEEEIGTYYIREISAPSGYLLNTTEVMVLVTSSTVYANAGTPNDGVTVARSAGYIVSTLDQMAVIGDIDNTLSWIKTTLQVNTSQANTFNFTEYVEATNDLLWTELSSHAYLEYDGTLKSTINDYVANSYYGSNTTKLSTNEGWSYLQIFQDTTYHQERVASGADVSYAYTEISTPITSLYSRSVYVQVTDQFVQVELPETGGVSLPVAYAVGSLMIIISAALLLRRRTKNSKKQNCQM